jgi:HEAT repeat protein
VLQILCRVLKEDSEPAVRAEAAACLAEFNSPDGLEALGLSLQDPSVEVVMASLESLRRRNNPDAIPQLVNVLGHPDPNARTRTLQVLKALNWQPRDKRQEAFLLVAIGEIDRASMLGRPAIEALTAVLQDGAYQRRVLAVNRLAEIGDASVVPVLIRLLSDADNLVRTAGANALASIGDARAVPGLLGLLTDKDPNVRVASAAALGSIADPSAVDQLLPLLTDAHWEVRATALEALGRLHDHRARDAMVDRLQDEDREVREKAAEALGLLGSPEAIGPLTLALLDPESTVRQSTTLALQRLDPYWFRLPQVLTVIPTVQAALQHPDYSVQASARDILQRVSQAQGNLSSAATADTEMAARQKAGLGLLADYLFDRDPALRQAAAEAILRTGEAELISRIQPLTADPDASVRAVALAGWRDGDPAMRR